MQEMKKNNKVFHISLVVVFAIVFWGIFSPENFENTANGFYEFVVGNFSWMYLLSMLSFVAFAGFLAFSKYGKIKLGSDDSVPEYSNTSWFAMLFGAGMGIGLVFWGVAEPLNHFVNPPFGLEGGTAGAANFAMKTSFLHWGFHPWANYSIFGLALAYFQFRKNKPGLISSVFIPLLGEERINGPIGKTIDILAIFATIAGVATSLGLGTLQINGGLNFLFGIPNTTLVNIIIIAVVTFIYIWTAVTGIEKGIKLLSDINLIAAIAILGLSIIVGPTVKMINIFLNGTGLYLTDFIRDSFRIEAFGDNSWTGGWTVFYWAWWIAWAPFVGTFIARISKGRSIREFVIGVIVAPSLASFVWFATFGTLGMNLGMDVATEAIQTTETALFLVMRNYPLGSIISFVAVFLLCTFFITSANSATFVLGMMSSNGDLNPSNSKKIIWGLVQSLLAVSLLLAGGLTTLQIGSIAAAFPFVIVMILSMVSLMKALKSDEKFD
ncbi:glycine betaine uptake BCCT transporter [Clostridium formicaceticum]|uniref:Glycine betaine transporter OpuD n=2 Tax=Clostridium formicaceticum TaxID=1497 RepID=A0AAC9RJ59_9CLOT|nr:Glycine betaine transporter OpuD [Clostridium formicaceticum]